MKRKLDENDAPVVAATEEPTNDDDEAAAAAATAAAQPDETPPKAGKKTTAAAAAAPILSFADLGLDPRLIQAVAQQQFEKPTLVQQRAIPLALNGRDVLAKAKTGSGKTAAYVLPVLQAILKRKQTDHSAFTSVLILVPTRELADQVAKSIGQLSAFCAKDVAAVKLTDKVSDAVLRSLLSNTPDIVVSTPARAWHAASNAFLALDRLTHLVLDEADLVMSYGYSEDLELLAGALPKGVQTILMSATLTTDVDTLKGLLCRNPALLNLEEKEPEGEGISQYVVKCGEDEKFLLAYVIFKLKLVTGKCLVFVADVDRCYRLKLFFEQFGIRSCVLNSELPVNSRIHCIEEFNRNVYDIIIASDEHELLGDEDQVPGDAKRDGDGDGDGANNEAPKKKKRKTTTGGAGAPKRDREFGVARGVDFKNVRAVINFDLPTSAKSYTHRIGRTARAGQTGMALSFAVPAALYRKHMPTTVETAAKDEKVLARIVRQQAKAGKAVKPYDFDMKQVEAFRYRMNDALRSVTKVAVREARTREIRQELLKSEKLKRHFEENPAELQHLARHDHELRTVRAQPHLKHVPEYLLPRDGKAALTGSAAAQAVGFVPLRRSADGKRGHGDRRRGKYYARSAKHARTFKAHAAANKRNPLRTFKAKSKR
ncbi:ATP dependent RNA helicase [Niveomyces insectorum RCEF 264]|uniref:RNA helicase n=1 Tax=Niveomyces insectorum RCEF 264 TaxID=1081102 RepID=A0A167NJ41_9HYPO|nr:ATP dependent RNA helicase [Niveomyces insectorum RCEF 264]